MKTVSLDRCLKYNWQHIYQNLIINTHLPIFFSFKFDSKNEYVNQILKLKECMRNLPILTS